MQPGGTVTVSWSGVPSPSSTDWIGVYHTGDANDAYFNWFYADSCTETPGTTALASGSCTYKLPTTNGTYELRLFANNTYTLLATTNTVTVTGGTMTASPASVQPGGTVTVSWSGVPSPSSTDWIGVYHTGDANDAYFNWFYADSCTETPGTTALASGSCTYKLPTTNGTYELRLFANNTYTLLATTNTVTVTGGTMTASPASVQPGGTVTVSWSGVPSPSSTDWIGVYHTGDANDAYFNWFYADSCTETPGTTALASGSCTYKLPTTNGTYELRLFANNTYTLLATTNTVTVTGGTMTASPASVQPGGTVTVSWSGVPSPSSTDWIGVYHTGDANDAYFNWFYADSCTETPGTTALASGSCTYKLPTTNGTYELRLFANNTYTLLATSNAVTVS